MFPLNKKGSGVKPPETNQTSRKFVEDVQENPLKICEIMGILFQFSHSFSTDIYIITSPEQSVCVGQYKATGFVNKNRWNSTKEICQSNTSAKETWIVQNDMQMCLVISYVTASRDWLIHEYIIKNLFYLVSVFCEGRLYYRTPFSLGLSQLEESVTICFK